MSYDVTDRVRGNERAKVYDGLEDEWVDLAGASGTVQHVGFDGVYWVIFDDDELHHRFGRIPMYANRIEPEFPGA